MVAELDPVVVEPATVNDAETVEMCYVICGEEGSKDVANQTSNSMFSEDIERIVNAEDKLELGGIL